MGEREQTSRPLQANFWRTTIPHLFDFQIPNYRKTVRQDPQKNSAERFWAHEERAVGCRTMERVAVERVISVLRGETNGRLPGCRAILTVALCSTKPRTTSRRLAADEWRNVWRDLHNFLRNWKKRTSPLTGAESIQIEFREWHSRPKPLLEIPLSGFLR